MRRVIFSIFLGVLGVLTLVTPCLAVNPPDSLEIHAIYGFENYYLSGDQLYLVEFTIGYSTLPSAKADANYILRFMENSTELAWTAPYPYHDKGYGRGVAAFYFDPASVPTGNCSVILCGNPLISWNGTFPYTSSSTYTMESGDTVAETQELVAEQVLDLAKNLETDWDLDMVTTSAQGSYLTDDGEAYFVNVIPYFTTAGTYAFYGNVYSPVYPPITTNYTYAETIEAMSENTIVDVGTPVGGLLGVERGLASTLVIYGIGIAGLIAICRGMNSYKPFMLLFGAVVAVAWCVGVPLEYTVYGGLIATFLIIFEVFYKPAPG